MGEDPLGGGADGVNVDDDAFEEFSGMIASRCGGRPKTPLPLFRRSDLSERSDLALRSSDRLSGVASSSLESRAEELLVGSGVSEVLLFGFEPRWVRERCVP